MEAFASVLSSDGGSVHSVCTSVTVEVRAELHSQGSSLPACLWEQQWCTDDHFNFLQLTPDKLMSSLQALRASLIKYCSVLVLQQQKTWESILTNTNLELHGNEVVQSCFLRYFDKIKSLLLFQDLEVIIHVFVFSRLDYCNAVFTTLSHSSVHSFIGYPLTTGFFFLILLIMYKALHGLAPLYISQLFCPQTSGRSLRYLRTSGCSEIQAKSGGDRDFTVVASTLWNRLPIVIKNAESVNIFKKL